MMVQFAVGNYHAIVSNIISLSKTHFGSVTDVMIFSYPLLLALIFFIDTAYFAFGYITESSVLQNKVKSVEPTLLGWVAALLCYPPFNATITSAIIPWYPNDGVRFWSTEATAIAYFVIIALYTIYVWASVALGTKCSNLTNRGIVKSGPYAYVRHPHYISKNLAWWITLIPIMSVPVFLSMAAWTIIYAIRAITEERHFLCVISMRIVSSAI
jgi:protein-S-isoprenylcysteine O-methyltransferase Ste14